MYQYTRYAPVYDNIGFFHSNEISDAATSLFFLGQRLSTHGLNESYLGRVVEIV